MSWGHFDGSLYAVTLAAFAVTLTGCGGGGGGGLVGGSDNGVAVGGAYDYTEGTPSTQVDANAALALTGLMPYDDDYGNSYTSLNSANSSLNRGGDFVATTDTGARTAWQAGWTGKNVKVGIADEFNSNGRLDTHGDYVSVIAESVAPEANYGYVGTLGLSANMTTQEGLEYFEANGYHIINASFGLDRDDFLSDADFDDAVADAVMTFDQATENGKQALIVYAAGNSGNTCSSKRGEDCDLQQAIVSALRDAGFTAGSKSIFVGSLGDGTNDVAGYSLIAGDMKYDFIVAHDDIVTSGDGAGTSFAAPRVTGAAALVRQKFPNLTSDQLKQVILQTADDLGAPGVDEVYGYGKLSVINALSPVGTVVPK